MVGYVFGIDSKGGIGQSTFFQNDGHHEKEEKESKIFFLQFLKRLEVGPKGRPSEASLKLFLSCWLFYS